jgi:hypothetical protein
MAEVEVSDVRKSDQDSISKQDMGLGRAGSRYFIDTLPRWRHGAPRRDS